MPTLTATKATLPTAAAPRPLRLVRCVVGAETYCVPLDCVLGIQRAERMRQNPHGDRPVGWLRDAYEGAPVFNLADSLGKSGNPAASAILVLDAHPRPFGLLVDRVGQVADVTVEDLMPLPPGAEESQQRLFRGVVRLPEGMILSIAPELLAADGHLRVRAPQLEATPQRRPTPVAMAAAPPPGPGKLLLFSTTLPDESDWEVTFGLSLSQVMEILAMPPLVPIPTAPPHVLGLVAWREQPVLVLDLGHRFGLASALFHQTSRLLIARTARSATLVGIPISTNVGSVDLPLPHQRWEQDLPLDRALTLGVYQVEGDALVIPHLDAVLA